MSENKYLKWLTSNTQSIYWNDSANPADIDAAIQNGATGVTTNPFLVNATLRGMPDAWQQIALPVDGALQGAQKAEALTKCVAEYIAKKVSPFRQSGEGRGYVCAQVNPADACKTEVMIEQAKRYAAWQPNIVVKLPANAAGLRAYEECAALGMNVAATVSFTVPQTLAFGGAFQRGIERARASGIKPGLGIAVLMEGRLDDYLRDVMNDTKADCAESDIIWSGIACMKRAYQIFGERGYACMLMPAGCRGSYHISELSGGKMVMSIGPAIAKALESEADFSKKIDTPVDGAVIKRLQTMKEFIKAYEPDGLATDEFIGYGVFNRTLTQFVECGWNPIMSI